MNPNFHKNEQVIAGADDRFQPPEEEECLRDEVGVGIYGCWCRKCCETVREEAMEDR